MIKPRKASCFGCPYELRYGESIPKKEMGVVMRLGERFCTAGKRARRFKRGDPKSAAPEWCPRRKKPHELRVYGFKDTESWMMHDYFCHEFGEKFSPDGFRYAVEFELHTELSPSDFLERCDMESGAELLGVAVHRHHVVEIDDGLMPAFFYKTSTGYRYEPFFNAKQARENKREHVEGTI